MKNLKSTAWVLLLALCVCGVSHASSVAPTTSATVTYTADNMVLDWWLIGPSGLPQPLSPGANWNDWQKADSFTLSNLEVGQKYKIVWEVQNLWGYPSPLPGPNNPAGFLAQVAFNGPAPILSSSSWEVAKYTSLKPFDQMTWVPATAIIENQADPSDSIWYRVNGGPISGIDGKAWWIWSENNIEHQHVFVRTTFEAPVPLPAAAWMLGAGLVGLVAVRRRR